MGIVGRAMAKAKELRERMNAEKRTALLSGFATWIVEEEERRRILSERRRSQLRRDEDA